MVRVVDMEVDDREVELPMTTTVVVREAVAMMAMVEVVSRIVIPTVEVASKIRMEEDARKAVDMAAATHMAEADSKIPTVEDVKKVEDTVVRIRMAAARNRAMVEDDRKAVEGTATSPTTSVLKALTLRDRTTVDAMDSQLEPPMVAEDLLPTTSPVQSRRLINMPAHQETPTCSLPSLVCSQVSTSKLRMKTWMKMMPSSNTRTFMEAAAVDMLPLETWAVPLLCKH